MAKKGQKAQPPGVPKGKAARTPVARGFTGETTRGYPRSKAEPPLWTNFGKALDGIQDSAGEIVRINAQIKELQAEAGAHRKAICDLMADYKKDESWSVRDIDAGWIATYYKPKPGKKLVPELLLSAGVTPKQLARGYKPTEPKKPYVQVKMKGEKEEGGEAE